MILTDYEQDITLFVSHGVPVEGEKKEKKNKGNTLNGTFYLHSIDTKFHRVIWSISKFRFVFSKLKLGWSIVMKLTKTIHGVNKKKFAINIHTK